MRKWLIRAGWMALGVAGLYGAAALAGVASGGPLDPPPGPVGSTLRSLSDIPPSWHLKLDATNGGDENCNSQRFTCVLDGGAVLDNETGLVWDRSPFTIVRNWESSINDCGSALIGDRGGWRLPTDTEVRSLLDPNASGAPLLPDGHPFNVFSSYGSVWTMSVVAGEADRAYAVKMDTLGRLPSPKIAEHKRWCVRGAQSDAPEDSEVAEQPPAWYETLDAAGGCFSERFRCVMENGEGVLDRETGLVWQRDLPYPGTSMLWNIAWAECQGLDTGGRGGWRLPTREELGSLQKRNDGFGNTLPPGHPFNIPYGTQVWTATTVPQFPTSAYWTNVGGGGGSAADKASALSGVLCVRGGRGHDGS